jgi:hypothetical protein
MLFPSRDGRQVLNMSKVSEVLGRYRKRNMERLRSNLGVSVQWKTPPNCIIFLIELLTFQ